jgi:hypothetical protein
MRGQYAGNAAAARTQAVDRAGGFSEKEESRNMPKRTKKLLVYLDQNFISEMAKADVNVKVKQEWKDLFSLLKEGFLEEKLVVPQSWFHDVETSFAPVLKKRIVSYQNYLGQVDLHTAPHVRINQTARFLERFLGKGNQDPLGTDIAFRDPPDRRVQQFNITVNHDLSQWGFDVQRVETATTLEAIRRECIAKKVRYEDHLDKEFDAHREDFLKNALYYQHLCDDPRRDLIAFSNAPIFRTVPAVNISSRLWSRLFTKFSTREIENGDATDIEVLSTYLPYMDVIGTDAFMATLLTNLRIDTEHQVKIFSAKTGSLRAFCDFLREYLDSTQPANRPSISAFVLPSQSVKENAFKLFRELAAAARLFGEEEYAEIYGFDDGQMPRYLLRGGGNIEVPFYGLQEVHPIKLEPGLTMEQILAICREHCKSDHFVLIEEYHPVKETFLVGAEMSAGAGVQMAEGCRIYAKKA